MVSVLIPSQLTSYTEGASRVAAEGATVEAALDDLDRRFPGLKFRVIDEQDRIRRHIRIFVKRKQVRDLGLVMQAGDRVRMSTGGGGGYGDPKERPVELVARDVIRGFVSRESARTDYGVSFDHDGTPRRV